MCNYEVLNAQKLNTLKASISNDGLLSNDVVVPFSTFGRFNPITAEANLSAVSTDIGLDECPTVESAVKHAKTTLSTGWDASISAIDPFYVAGSINDISATFTMTGEDALQPMQIKTISGIRNTLAVIQMSTGTTYPLDTVPDLYFAAASLSSGESLPSDAIVAWQNGVLTDPSVSSLVATTLGELAECVA